MVRHTGEDFVDVESVAVASVLAFQAPSVFWTEFDTPKADGFTADSDAALGEKIFDISMAQVEAIVEPDRVTDDVGWESVALVGIHPPIVSISVSLLVSTLWYPGVAYRYREYWDRFLH